MGLLTESGSSGAVWPTPSPLLVVADSSSVSCVAMLQTKDAATTCSNVDVRRLLPAVEMSWDKPARGAAAATRMISVTGDDLV